jgi:hypothetical protein
MNRANLIPDTAEVELVCLRQRAGSIEVELRACQTFSVCPSCAGRSSRVHSRYRRKISDLPWEGVPVEILLQARKFFCDQERCSRRIFTEKLPGTVERYSRRSRRSSEALSAITMSLGARTGARLARNLGLLASGPTLLRVLRMQSRPPISLAPGWLELTSGHGRRATVTEQFFVIWSSAELSICCRIVVRRQ